MTAADHFSREIDSGKVAKKIEKRKAAERAYSGAKKTVRAARRAGNFYSNNRTWIDDLLRLIFGE